MIEYITKNEFLELSKCDEKYYNNRWQYFEEVINILERKLR